MMIHLSGQSVSEDQVIEIVKKDILSGGVKGAISVYGIVIVLKNGGRIVKGFNERKERDDQYERLMREKNQ